MPWAVSRRMCNGTGASLAPPRFQAARHWVAFTPLKCCAQLGRARQGQSMSTKCWHGHCGVPMPRQIICFFCGRGRSAQGSGYNVLAADGRLREETGW